MATDLTEQRQGNGDSPLMKMSVEQIDEATARMERFAASMRQFHVAACKATLPHDWIDFGGKPYLEGEGAMRIAAAVGLQLSAPVFADEKGEWFEGELFFECAVEATWPLTGATIVGTGDCNSKDKFFAEGANSHLAKALAATNGNERLARKLIALDVKKKAISNAISNAVKGVLGLKGLTWEDLKALGMGQQQAGAKVEYKKGGVAQKKDAPAQLKTVKIGELLKLPKDSKVAVGGELTEPVIVKGLPPKAWHMYTLKDDTGTAAIGHYVKDAVKIPEEAIPGNYIHFPQVEVGEWQGRKQLKAWSIELPTGAPQAEPGANDGP